MAEENKDPLVPAGSRPLPEGTGPDVKFSPVRFPIKDSGESKKAIRGIMGQATAEDLGKSSQWRRDAIANTGPAQALTPEEVAEIEKRAIDKGLITEEGLKAAREKLAREDADPETYKAVEPEMEEMRRLDLEAHSVKTSLEQNDAETKLRDQITKISGRTGISSDAIIEQLRKERVLQGDATKAEELARSIEQFDTAVKYAVFGVKPTELPGKNRPKADPRQ